MATFFFFSTLIDLSGSGCNRMTVAKIRRSPSQYPDIRHRQRTILLPLHTVVLLLFVFCLWHLGSSYEGWLWQVSCVCCTCYCACVNIPINVTILYIRPSFEITGCYYCTVVKAHTAVVSSQH